MSESQKAAILETLANDVEQYCDMFDFADDVRVPNRLGRRPVRGVQEASEPGPEVRKSLFEKILEERDQHPGDPDPRGRFHRLPKID